MTTPLRIGSRPSRLALTQADIVKRRLAQIAPEFESEIVPIKTSGDKMTSASLADVGGKGLFVRELEQALADRRIDLAVHSMKDLPATVPKGFVIAAVPEREDVRDALISRTGGGIESLPRGARVGTSSSRRRFEALRVRPDLAISPLRGNVDTRLERLARGELDAIIVAIAGLRRLARIEGLNLEALDERDFVPAGGQGALAIETALKTVVDPGELSRALGQLNDPRASCETSAERAFLARIGASCASPVGVRVAIENGAIIVRARLFSIDGTKEMFDSIVAKFDGKVVSAIDMGERLARRMLAAGAAELIAAPSTRT